MKQSFYLSLALILLVSIGCKKDSTTDTILSYDGENFTGPLLAAGFHETAVLFPSNLTGTYQGRQLIAVQYFMGAKPQQAEIRIYGEGTPSFPGQLLYSAVVTDQIRTLQWNEHTISTPIDISEEDLWISVALTHASEQQSIGCDAGPNVANGDWLFQSADNQWDSYRNRTGESVNWNIRGKISEE